MDKKKDTELKDRIRLYQEDEENYVYAIPVADVVVVILKIWGDVVDEMIDHDAPWSGVESQSLKNLFMRYLDQLSVKHEGCGEKVKKGAYTFKCGDISKSKKVQLCYKCKQKQEKTWDDRTYTYDDVKKQEEGEEHESA